MYMFVSWYLICLWPEFTTHANKNKSRPSAASGKGPIKQCNGEQFTLRYETVQILFQTMIVYSDKSTNRKHTGIIYAYLNHLYA